MIPDDDQDFLDYCAVQVVARIVPTFGSRDVLPEPARVAQTAYQYANAVLVERRRRRAALEAEEAGKSRSGADSSDAENIPGAWWRDR